VVVVPADEPLVADAPLLWTLIFRKGSPKPDDREGSTTPKAPETPPRTGMFETPKGGVF
jgi:hypothetical protein